MANSPGIKKTFLVIIALIGWFALIAQFYININSKAASIPEIITRYFSYFTILTNIIVALHCTILLLRPASGLGKFLSRQTTAAAITVYIVMVGIVYNIILRSLWAPKGLQLIVDEILHLVTPMLFLLYWLFFIRKKELKWGNAFSWMIYPLIYGSFVLIRGYFSNPSFYPYPFIDMSKLGINMGIINTIGFTIIFYIASLVFIAMGKLMHRNNQ